MTTTGPSSFGQLEVAGKSSSRRLVAAEDPSSTGERKVHLHSNTNGEKYIRKFEAAQRGFTRILHSSTGQCLCKMWLTSHPYPRFPTQRRDLEPIHERLLVVFILADQGSRRLQKDGDIQKFPKDAIFDAVRTTTSENTDRTQRCIQHANTAGLEHISLVKSYVAE